MIEINLIPDHLRKKKPAATKVAALIYLPKEVMIGFVGGLILLLIVVHIFLQMIIFKKYAAYKKLQKEWEEILPTKGRVDVVVNNLRVLQAKIKAIERVTDTKNILWWQKLNAISDVLPHGVWLQSINYEGATIVIKGSAVSKKQKEEMINVHVFASNLKQHENFMHNLKSLEVESIQRRKIKAIDLSDFSMLADVQKQ